MKYPELAADGEKAAQELINRFKEQMATVATGIIGTLYTDIMPHISSDSWQNYRNKLMDGFRGYGDTMINSEYDFKAIREKIFKDYCDEIIRDLNQENLKRIKELESLVEYLRDRYQY